MAIKFDNISDGYYRLDVTGYVCPHPQMYTKKVLGKLKPDEVLTLLFDNPSSGESIISMCEAAGDEVFDKSNNGGVFQWKIRKG